MKTICRMWVKEYKYTDEDGEQIVPAHMDYSPKFGNTGWVSNHLLDDPENEGRDFRVKIRLNDILSKTEDLMYWIGLNDVNDKMIFELDIVKWKNKIYKVYWDKNDAMFHLENQNPAGLMCFHKEFEVISNVFEYKELLK